MVKLYYTPTSCGASSFICAFASGLQYDCEIVDLKTHLTSSGVDFYTINPKGNVPCIVLDDGTFLNENIVCLEYIADQSSLNLAPSVGTNERYVLRQLLSFLASELHSSIGLFFSPESNDPFIRKFLIQNFNKKMKYLEDNILNDDQFLYGDSFTIADAYLYIILGWLSYVGLSLDNYQTAKKYHSKINDLTLIRDAKQRMSSSPDKIAHL